ncbi:PH domain-containing protein [soil metagenome]
MSSDPRPPAAGEERLPFDPAGRASWSTVDRPTDTDLAPVGAPAMGGRLHPAAVVLGPLGQLVPLFVLAAFGLLARGGGAFVLLGVLMVASLVSSALRWGFFRWELTEDSLVITEGVLQRQRRVIPLSRIHTVDLARPLWHRALGVVKVHVETVGGGDTEGQFEALSPAEAARLRALLLGLDGTAPVDAAGDQPPPLAALSPGMLVIAGLTGGRIGVAAALVGFSQQVVGERIFDWVDDLTALGITSVLILGTIGLVAVFLLSVIATAITFWGFELRQEGTDLTVRRGLLEKRFDTVPLGRVQGVLVQENLLRRPFGLAAVQVVVAGRAGGEAAAQQALVLPLGTRTEALRLAGHLVQAAGLDAVQLTPMPRRARTRRLWRAAGATASVTVFLTAWLGVVGLLGLASALVWIPLGLAGYRALGHARMDGFVIARQGAVVRTTAVVPLAKIQSTGTHQTLFQRRLRLATARIHIATTTRASTIELIDVDAVTAGEHAVDLLPDHAPTDNAPTEDANAS